ncbi:MAG: DUF5655 domain-containing protein [Chloroflexota bacterium]|nr:DUF5655 domain-containing protein [Chloroflexota bacterium]
MEDARDAVRNRISQVKTFLAQEQPPRLSESDTKANFIEPIVAALGWEGIGVVTREYYVRNSQEFIDYVMRGPRGLLLAIEAKPLQVDLTDKHAAQLIQYCAVEGIEWAALTNGRELQFFNTFLKPDLAAKRVLRLDLLAFNTDEEFDALFGQIWQLSRESMTEPKGVRTWLNQRRLDAALRTVLLDPNSATIRHLRRVLSDQEIAAGAQDLAQWFRSHLGTPIASIPIPTHQFSGAGSTLPGVNESRRSYQPTEAPPPTERYITEQVADVSGSSEFSVSLFLTLRDVIDRRNSNISWRIKRNYVAAASDGSTFLAVQFRADRILLGLTLATARVATRFTEDERLFRWARITKTVVVRAESDIDTELLDLIAEATAHVAKSDRKASYYGVTLRELLDAGFLEAGTQLLLLGNGNREIARATLNQAGEIEWQGNRYRSPSNRDFTRLLGRTFNGWTHWFADLPHGKESLHAIRDRYQTSDGRNHDSSRAMG